MLQQTSAKLSEKELTELIRTAQSGCDKSMWKVVLAHQHLIKDAEQRWYFLEADECTKYHGALMGLIAAVKKFDFSTQFEIYARKCAYRRLQQEATGESVVSIPRNSFFEMLKNQEIPHLRLVAYEECEINIDNKPVRRIKSEFTREDHALNEEKEIVKNAINRLPIEEKEAIAMEYGFSDESKVEMCQRLGYTRQWVEKLVEKGHNRLKKILSTKGIKQCTV